MNEIIREMKLMEQVKGTAYFPMPTYLYLQAYGKDLKEDIEDLAKATKSKQSLIFDKLKCNPGRSLIDDFEVLLEKNKPLGQEFEGLVLIDFTGFEESELSSFAEYLKGKQYRNTYIFTIQMQAYNMQEIKKILEKNFFLRVVEAMPYSTKDLYYAIFDYIRVCEYNGIDLEFTEDGQDSVRKHLAEREWQKEDDVIFRLRNAVAAAIYEQMVSSQSKHMEIDEEFITQMFEKLEEKQEPKRRIGFCVGGFENE